MKAFYTQKKLDKCWNARTKIDGQTVVPYVIVHSCAVLLDHFGWSVTRVEELLNALKGYSELVNSGLCTILSFNVLENYGLNLKINNINSDEEMRKNCSKQSAQMYRTYESMSFMCINTIVYTLINDFKWSDSTVQKFCSLYNKYAKGMYNGIEQNIYNSLKRLKEQYDFNLSFINKNKRYEL